MTIAHAAGAEYAPLLQEAMSGEESRGSDGVVYYNKAQSVIRYMKIHEIESEELRERVEDIVTEEGAVFYFVLEEIDRVMHIWKIPKRQAMQQIMHDVGSDPDVQVCQLGEP